VIVVYKANFKAKPLTPFYLEANNRPVQSERISAISGGIIADRKLVNIITTLLGSL